jgi:hypothetical protein
MGKGNEILGGSARNAVRRVGGVHDPSVLDELEKGEEGGGGRVTVLRAIRRRREELAGGQGSGKRSVVGKVEATGKEYRVTRGLLLGGQWVNPFRAARISGASAEEVEAAVKSGALVPVVSDDDGEAKAAPNLTTDEAATEE